jgi:hypothetical protein
MEGNGSYLIDLRKTMRKLRIASDPAEIRTEYPPY